MPANDLQQIAEIFLSEDAIENLCQCGSFLVERFRFLSTKKTSLCNDTLFGRCETKTGPCSYLHTCRHLGDCRNSTCRRPHDFSREPNYELVCQAQCQNLSPVLLFRLLQLKRQNVEREAMEKSSTSTSVDLICPSLVRNQPVDIGHLEKFLRSNGFPIKKILLLTKDEYFHRWRISLRDDQSKSFIRHELSSSFCIFRH